MATSSTAAPQTSTLPVGIPEPLSTTIGSITHSATRIWTAITSTTTQLSSSSSLLPTSESAMAGSSTSSSTLKTSTTLSSTPSPSPRSTASLSTLLMTHTTAFMNSTMTTTSNSLPVITSTNGTDMTSSNLSEEARMNYLDILQEDTTRKLTPTIVFLTLIAVIGLFGNIIVLLVYSRKVRRSATDIFIMAIAAFDLLTNVGAIPAEIYDTFHYWDFEKVALCKIRVYCNAFTTLSSAMILLAVAVSRYKKICRPFGKQTTVRTAKIVSVSLAIVISVAASPQLILYGVQTKPTPLPDVFGKECSTADAYLDTIWPMMYMAFLMLLFLGTCTPLVVLYILIGIQAWRHSKIHGIPMVTKTPSASTDHSHTVSTGSETLESEDDSLRKPQGSGVFRCLKKGKKQSYAINLAPVGSCKEETRNSQEAPQMKSENNNALELVELDYIDQEDEKQSTPGHSKQENYCTKMVTSPTKDKARVHVPMLRELSTKLNQLKDSKSDNMSDDNDDANAEETNKENQDNEKSDSRDGNDSCAPTHEESRANGVEGNENKSENKDDNTSTGMSEFARSMLWVDITYCLNEKNNLEKQAETQSEERVRKKSSQSRKVSRDNSLRHKLTDTLTRARKVKKQSLASDKNNLCGKEDCSDKVNCKHIQFNETVVDSSGGTRSQQELKSSDTTPNVNGQLKNGPKASKSNPQHRVLTRTTLMLIIISAVYVIAFLPHLLVITFKLMISNFIENMSDAGYAVYNIFLRFYFINSAGNPLIYSLCDARFRAEVGKLFRCQK